MNNKLPKFAPQYKPKEYKIFKTDGYVVRTGFSLIA